uniref:Uncharacterized protein n=1 Tax=Rhizophora mucronata TaxID=61149 RepID=A0A2P2R0L3_RHIMU
MNKSSPHSVKLSPTGTTSTSSKIH